MSFCDNYFKYFLYCNTRLGWDEMSICEMLITSSVFDFRRYVCKFKSMYNPLWSENNIVLNGSISTLEIKVSRDLLRNMTLILPDSLEYVFDSVSVPYLVTTGLHILHIRHVFMMVFFL